MLTSWDSFDRYVLIDKSIEYIYPLWASAQGLTEWFLRESTYIMKNDNPRAPAELYQKGDRYVWKWHQWDAEGRGEVLEQNGVDLIKFSFESSIVHVHLERFDDGRTLVKLTQSEIADSDEARLNIYCGCGSGWTFWLTNLKAYCEHGILLNEQGMNLRGIFDGYKLVNT